MLWVVGIGYFVISFDITNVAFGLPVFSKILHITRQQQASPITASVLGYVAGVWLTSNCADTMERKAGTMTAAILFVIGCLITALLAGLGSMVIG